MAKQVMLNLVKKPNNALVCGSLRCASFAPHSFVVMFTKEEARGQADPSDPYA